MKTGKTSLLRSVLCALLVFAIVGACFALGRNAKASALDEISSNQLTEEFRQEGGMVILRANGTYYTITYDANGGSGAPSKQLTGYGNPATISTKQPTRSGYKFKGWATSKGGSVAYAPGAKYTGQKDLALYAVWVKTYTVTYNANGGQQCPSSQTKVHGETLKLTTATPYKEGYNFGGWKGSNGTTYKAGANYTGNANLTLTAIWNIKTYTVTYDGNGGQQVPSKQTKNYAQTLTLTTATPYREGYNFGGWKGSDGKTYAKGGSYTSNANITMTAIWNPITYSITYNLNGGSGSISNQTKGYNTGITLSKTVPTKDGYNFGGWKGSNGSTYQAGASYAGNANLTLTAIWNIKTYTVTYAGNGGQQVPGNQTKTHGTNLTLTTATPYKEGYNFGGWKGSDGKTYTKGGSYTSNANITMTAIWNPITYSITYNLNGGSGSISNQSKGYNAGITLSKTVPTKDGYNFGGWKGSNGTTYQAGASYAGNANLTLTAIWNIKTYTVTYAGDGGKQVPGNQTKTHGTTLKLTTATPYKEGYNFGGWKGSDGKTYASGDNYTTNANITMTAIWNAITYTVKFDLNGGSGTIADQKVPYCGSVTLTKTVPTRTGYDFGGWKSPNGIIYQPGSSYAGNADATLIAVWSIKTYTVTYVGDGGQQVPGKQTKTYGTSLKLTTATPYKEGYNFGGWKGSDGKTYASGDTYTTNADITMTAIWKGIIYSIHYDLNGGTGSIADQTKGYNGGVTLSKTIPTKDGYDFGGWKGSNGTTYQAGASYAGNADITLTAIWTLKKYTVSFDGNGGKEVPGNQTKTHGTSLKLTTATPYKEGYNFGGWKGSDGKTYASGDNYTTNANITMTAIWNAITYTVKFDLNGGSGTIADQKVPYCGSVTLTKTVPTRTGYDFGGWKSPNGIIYQPGSSYAGNADATLIAVWSIKTYTVTYVGDGGQQVPGKQTKTHGTDLTLTTATPYKEGYNFGGWKGSDGKTYASGDTYTTNADITMTAIWKGITYTIHYNLNGGTGSFADQTKGYNGGVTLSKTIPTKDGYDFGGWKGSNGTTYQAGSSYAGNANLTLTAIWTLKRCTVYYNGNGGTGATGEHVPASYTQFVYGASVTINDTCYVYTGHKFLGWATADNKNLVVYHPGDTAKFDDDITLYAVWELNTYTITYDVNGGSGAPVKQTKTYGVDLKLSTKVPVREGYIFKGWSTTTDPGKKYQPGDLYKLNQGAKLYANWEIIKHTVTYNGNGGTGATGEHIPAAYTEFAYGTSVTINDTCYVYTGHKFLGWATADNKNLVVYHPGDTAKFDGDIILYAVWELYTYSITYDTNGGSGAPVKQTKTYGVDLKLSMKVPVREGYIFKGWSTTSSPSTLYQPGDLYKLNQGAKFYANWEIIKYTVTYVCDGSQQVPGNQTKTYGTDLKLTTAVPHKEGFDFCGWKGSDGKTYGSGDTYTDDADIIMTAIWKGIVYTIEYDLNGAPGKIDAQIKRYNETITLSEIIPEYEGFEFCGWNDTEGYIYTSGAIYAENKNLKLTAIWAPKVYKVEYWDGIPDDVYYYLGSHVSVIEEYEYGKEIVLLDEEYTTYAAPLAFADKYYHFLGWSTEKGACIPEYNPGERIEPFNKDTKLYAVWDTFIVFRVMFDFCDGEDGPDTILKAFDENVMIPYVTPFKTGYDFLGWGIEKNGEVVYEPGDIYEAYDDITLYAIWQKKTISITYISLEGKRTDIDESALSYYDSPRDDFLRGTPQKLKLGEYLPFYWQDHYIYGYALESPDSEQIFYPGQEVSFDKDTYLYVLWRTKQYNIVYLLDGTERVRTVDMGTKVTIEGDTKTVQDESGTVYSLYGWNICYDVSSYNKDEIVTYGAYEEPQYVAGKTYEPLAYSGGETVYLTPVYRRSVTIAYDLMIKDELGQELVITNAKTICEGTCATAETAENLLIQRKGYKLLGWVNNPNFIEASYDEDGVLVVTREKFRPYIYPQDISNLTYSEAMRIIDEQNELLNNNSYADVQNVIAHSQNLTLYAVWAPESKEVLVSAQGGYYEKGKTRVIFLTAKQFKELKENYLIKWDSEHVEQDFAFIRAFLDGLELGATIDGALLTITKYIPWVAKALDYGAKIGLDLDAGLLRFQGYIWATRFVLDMFSETQMREFIDFLRSNNVFDSSKNLPLMLTINYKDNMRDVESWSLSNYNSIILDPGIESGGTWYSGKTVNDLIVSSFKNHLK